VVPARPTSSVLSIFARLEHLLYREWALTLRTPNQNLTGVRWRSRDPLYLGFALKRDLLYSGAFTTWRTMVPLLLKLFDGFPKEPSGQCHTYTDRQHRKSGYSQIPGSWPNASTSARFCREVGGDPQACANNPYPPDPKEKDEIVENCFNGCPNITPAIAESQLESDQSVDRVDSESTKKQSGVAA
jgi:hypothetical protein